MNKVYIMDIKILLEEAAFSRACSFIGSERLKTANAFVRTNDKLRSIAAGWLFSYGLKEYGLNVHDVTIKYTEHKKPYLKDHPEIHFNLSHSGDYAVCAFSDSNVGVDIEKLREVTPSLLKYTLDKEEFAFLDSVSEDRLAPEFFRFWTEKESFVKYLGIGLSIRPADIKKEFYEEIKHVSFHHFEKLPGYCLTVCGSEAAPEYEFIDEKYV